MGRSTVVVVGLLAAFAAGAGAAVESRILDDFEDIAEWQALASEGARIAIHSDRGVRGNGLRLDFDFRASGGYVNVKKHMPLRLPPNYRFRFALRGDGRRNNLEFKLLDSSGRNVWWHNRPDVAFDTAWRSESVWREQIDFAWGPTPGELREVAFVEFTIKASEGGRGSVWFDQLAIEEHLPVAPVPPVPRVAAVPALAAQEIAALHDGDRATQWIAAPAHDGTQSLRFDFGATRLLGGLIIAWASDRPALTFELATSEDGAHWTDRMAVTDPGGELSPIYFPDTAARFVRLELRASTPSTPSFGIREIDWIPYHQARGRNQCLSAVARRARRGLYPRYLLGEQTFWTVVGVDGDAHEALLNEDGMVEVVAGGLSLEPFLATAGGVLTWADVELRQGLRDGDLPMPSVGWRHGDLHLDIAAVASGTAGAADLHLRYRVSNHGASRQPVALLLGLRPLQVNPPWQSLNGDGGVGVIRAIARDGATVHASGADPGAAQAIVFSPPPDRFGAARFIDGGLSPETASGSRPQPSATRDDSGLASAIAAFDLDLGAGEQRSIEVAIPWHRGEAAAARFDDAAAVASRHWRERLGEVDIEVTCAPELGRLVRSTLAYTLINRDGPALQPGSRNYARSWIRDGALTAVALLQFGMPQPVRDYLVWYAAQRLSGGRIPCCVDARGPDPTPEHDSDGEFIYAVAEYVRATGDLDLARVLWPRVEDAAEHLIELRATRTGPGYEHGDGRRFRGLLPESISHEGYAAQPVHSYWDDFFGLRGLVDAARLARLVGHESDAERFAAVAAEFAADIAASLQASVAHHRIDYIPGSVELGDFDAPATAIALSLDLALNGIDRELWQATFDRYLRFFRERAASDAWLNFAPYEFRVVDALVRLGDRGGANEVLRFLVDQRQPAAWNHWPEVVWREARQPRFLGDLPHTWIGAGFLSSLRTMLAYERDGGRTVVIGAGIDERWLRRGCRVAARRLAVGRGTIDLEMAEGDDGQLQVSLAGELAPEVDSVIVRPPRMASVAAVYRDGAPMAFDADGVRLRKLPARLRFESR